MKWLAIVVLLGIARAQPTFEVASVKRARNEDGPRGGCHGTDTTYPPALIASAPPLGRCVITGALLDDLLAISYQFRFMESIKGGPGWARDGGVRFNLEAQAEDPSDTTDAQLLEMLRTLLVDRFKIKLRTEIEHVPGFALVVAKNGPKFQPTKSDEPAFFKVISGSPMTLSARQYSMRTFAVFLDLRNLVKGPIVDETGLTGAYNLDLSWDEQNGPSLLTVLRELGLRLEPRKLPASSLIIESAEMPTEN